MIFSQLKQWSAKRKAATASVLAVCVLAAGVVAVAVLAGSDRDGYDDPCLENAMSVGEQATTCGRVCNDVELFDHALYQAELAGMNAGHAGHAAGCIPVCVWHNDDDLAVEPEEVMYYRAVPSSVVIDSSGVIAPHRNYLFQTPETVFCGWQTTRGRGALCFQRP